MNWLKIVYKAKSSTNLKLDFTNCVTIINREASCDFSTRERNATRSFWAGRLWGLPPLA